MMCTPSASNLTCRIEQRPFFATPQKEAKYSNQGLSKTGPAHIGYVALCPIPSLGGGTFLHFSLCFFMIIFMVDMKFNCCTCCKNSQQARQKNVYDYINFSDNNSQPSIGKNSNTCPCLVNISFVFRLL